MPSLTATMKSRAAQQAAANTETHAGQVKKLYTDANGNVTAADVHLHGQPYPLVRIPNSSGLRLYKGQQVSVNWFRGSRLGATIEGASGAESGSVVAAASTQETSAAFGTTSTAGDLSGIPLLLSDYDETVPDGLVEVPGANVYFTDLPAGEGASGAPNGQRRISAVPLVLTALPSPIGLSAGTAVDLVDSYGNSLGMYRLSASGSWVRRDIGSPPPDKPDKIAVPLVEYQASPGPPDFLYDDHGDVLLAIVEI